jgi:hypothetical protein
MGGRQNTVLRGPDRRRFWPRALLAAEVALALVLVTGASLLGYSLVKLHQIPIGFEPGGLVMLPLEMSKQARDGAALIEAYHQIGEGCAAIPGVQTATFESVVPLSGSRWTKDVHIPGLPTHEIFRNITAPAIFMRCASLSWPDAISSGATPSKLVASLF